MKNATTTYATLFTSTPEEAELFDRWLAERELDCAVAPCADMSDEYGVVDARKLERAKGDYSGEIVPGQVRILSKRFTETPETVPFVVVLEKWEARYDGDDMWLVAPFSRYSTPATSGEMSSGSSLFGREVVQAWNARTVQDSLLRFSFLCGGLDERAVSEARALFRNKFAGTELPADFAAQRGSDVILESDPRRDYMAEEMCRLSPLSTAVKATERARAENLLVIDFSQASKGKEDGTVLQPLYGSESYRLAAADRQVPTTEHFRVLGDEFTLAHSPEEGAAIFTFWNEDDQPDPRYDGCAIIGTGGKFLGVFRNGSLRVAAENVRGWFQLTDKDGNAMKLVSVGE